MRLRKTLGLDPEDGADLERRIVAGLEASGIAAGSVDAVGHRVIHGGRRYTDPTPVDPDVEAVIDDLSRLAPLHNPAALAGLRAARERFPGRPMVAVFVQRIVRTTGGYLTLLDGEGAVVFGGGIGSNSAVIRRRVADGLGAWGVELDPARNADPGEGRLSRPGSRPAGPADRPPPGRRPEPPIFPTSLREDLPTDGSGRPG